MAIFKIPLSFVGSRQSLTKKKNIFHDSKSSLNYSNHNVCYSFPLEAL